VFTDRQEHTDELFSSRQNIDIYQPDVDCEPYSVNQPCVSREIYVDDVCTYADGRLSTLILQQSAAMNEPMIWITVPDLSQGFTVRFSAYGFGWGYRAFAVSYEAVCESLGAGDTTEEQIRLAFQLGKRQILQAVLQHESLSYQGQRISLSLERRSHSTSPDAPETMTGSEEAAILQPASSPSSDPSMAGRSN
jgi:hypothetical protein